jgi:stearoyl-CoA desaturase (Delta-9 desaturase)
VGIQPYTDENTARDNAVVALLTFGEGYHNFHHMFAHDYRNGVRWWQWDPSKWLIYAMQWVGLTTELKRVPWFKIQRAVLDNQFRRAERQLALHSRRRTDRTVENARRRGSTEPSAMPWSTWTQLREQWLQEAKRAMIERWERSILQSRLKELEHGLYLQNRRMRVLRARLG